MPVVGVLVVVAACGDYGSDIVGFRGFPTTEALIRWAQYASMGTIMQLGGGGTSHNPWDTTLFTAGAEVIYKRYADLHMQLNPLLWTLALRAGGDGTPITIPACFLYDCAGDDAAFFLGSEKAASAAAAQAARPDRLVHQAEAQGGEGQAPRPAAEEWPRGFTASEAADARCEVPPAHRAARHCAGWQPAAARNLQGRAVGNDQRLERRAWTPRDGCSKRTCEDGGCTLTACGSAWRCSASGSARVGKSPRFHRSRRDRLDRPGDDDANDRVVARDGRGEVPCSAHGRACGRDHLLRSAPRARRQIQPPSGPARSTAISARPQSPQVAGASLAAWRLRFRAACRSRCRGIRSPDPKSAARPDVPSTELLLRWISVSALGTIMRIDSSRIDADTGAGYRTYAELHMQLNPLLWTLALQAGRDGTPVTRPAKFMYDCAL